MLVLLAFLPGLTLRLHHSFHRYSDAIAQHRVPYKVVRDLSSVPARALHQRWGGFRVGPDLADCK
jgi:hypothetical protein